MTCQPAIGRMVLATVMLVAIASTLFLVALFGKDIPLTRADGETTPATGPPGAPRNLTATPGNKEITLSWDPPADNSNAPATRYRIEWRIDGKDYSSSQWGTSRKTTYTTPDQANLANGVKYFFRVKAENGSGNSYGPYGPASEEVSATPTSGSAVDLGTPVLSNTENLHHGMVRLDWQDIENAGLYLVQYYHIDGSSGEWLDLPAVGVDIAFHGSSAVVSNLYGLSWLRVRAMSCAGASEWSEIEQLFGTNASDWEDVPVPELGEGEEIEPCSEDADAPDKPRGLSATATHGQVVLTWDDPQDDSITGYVILRRVRVNDTGGDFRVLVADTGTAALTYTDNTVAASTTYTYRIKAINEHGASERSRWFHIETPAAPSGPPVTEPVVRFQSPPETISGDVTGPYYIVGGASKDELISITTNTGFILSRWAGTETHCPIYFQRPGGNLKLAPVVDGYVPTENGEQIHYRNGEPVTENVDNSYMAMTYLGASTEGFYLRNCATEPMDGYVAVTTYRDDDVTHLVRIRITQPSPFVITTGAPPD